MIAKHQAISKRVGGDRAKRNMRRYQEEEPIVYEEGAKYSKSQLATLADQLLREDAKSELCRECGERGKATGHNEAQTYEQVKDGEGTPLAVSFPEYKCPSGHIWYLGEGTVRGIGGDNPILFEEHFQSRRRREIYTTVGTPDPSIVVGMYNRTHPQGRKVNSEEQRKRNGASFFR